MIGDGADFELTAHAAFAVRERDIDIQWVPRALERPARTEPARENPSLRHVLLAIPEPGNLVLRVVADPVATPVRVVTAYFDRRMRGKL